MAHQPSAIEQRIGWTRFRRQTDKDVLLALARWFCWRSDGTGVRPSSVDALAAKSGVPKRSVTRALRRLTDDGWLAVEKARHRQTATYRITLDRLATADPERPTVVVDHTRDLERHSWAPDDALSAKVALKTELERHSGAQDESGAQENRRDFEKVALPYRSEEEVQEIRPSTTDRERHSGAQAAARALFAAWWTATYPEYNDGAHDPVSVTHDGLILDELFAAYTFNDLTAMARLLWQVVPDGNAHSHRSWIATTNRSLRVLRRKAAFLRGALNAPEQLTLGPLEQVALSSREIEEAHAIRTRAYGGCPHEPRCTETAACVRAIAVARRVAAG